MIEVWYHGLEIDLNVQIFSLWSVSPKIYGGLGFTTSEVGDVLAVTGMRHEYGNWKYHLPCVVYKKSSCISDVSSCHL